MTNLEPSGDQALLAPGAQAGRGSRRLVALIPGTDLLSLSEDELSRYSAWLAAEAIRIDAMADDEYLRYRRRAGAAD